MGHPPVVMEAAKSRVSNLRASLEQEQKLQAALREPAQRVGGRRVKKGHAPVHKPVEEEDIAAARDPGVDTEVVPVNMPDLLTPELMRRRTVAEQKRWECPSTQGTC